MYFRCYYVTLISSIFVYVQYVKTKLFLTVCVYMLYLFILHIQLMYTWFKIWLPFPLTSHKTSPYMHGFKVHSITEKFN
jgi:hypothetical protein